MAGRCCSKPITRIIKVADFEAGLIGLDQALQDVAGQGLIDEEDIQRELLHRIKEFGNYISSSREGDYRKALLREYRAYTLNRNRSDFLPRRGAPGSSEK